MSWLSERVFWTLTVSFVVILAAAYANRVRTWSRALQAGRKHNEILQEELAEFGVAMELSTAEMEHAAKSLKEVLGQLAKEQATVASLQKAVETVIAEREQWRSMYMQHAREHGNAQSMLMSERERLCAQLRAAKLVPRTNPRLEAVVREYDETHVSRAIEEERKAAELISSQKVSL